MKSKEQIIEENRLSGNGCAIFTLNEFMKELDDNTINSNDGDGYFHDGENATDLSVWNNELKWNDVKDFPYVCWYNK